LTEIKGVGRRYSNIVCKKADVDLNKRCVVPESTDWISSSWLTITSAGELNSDELERLVTIIQNPTQFKIPTWFLNRQKDIVDGKNSQILSNGVDSKLRDDLERLKKIRAHRGLRHFWGLRVRGQHTKTTGALIIHLVFFARILTRCFIIVKVVAERPLVCQRSAVKFISPLVPLHAVRFIHVRCWNENAFVIGIVLFPQPLHDRCKTCSMRYSPSSLLSERSATTRRYETQGMSHGCP